tara:strand:- start:106 stop:285 length:180 start_codon:yes stop_codon:yes gene_type:complete
MIAATTTEVMVHADVDIRTTEGFYDGEKPCYEGDECVEIANFCDTSQDLKGWVLLDVNA